MGLFDAFRKKPKSLADVLNSHPTVQQQKALYDSLCLSCEAGVDADEMPNGQGEFGMSPENPIPTKTVFGSTAYLGRLRMLDGTKVTYKRFGSCSSTVSSNPVDGYLISRPDGQELATLFLSPYQKRISQKAPKGFALAESSFH